MRDAVGVDVCDDGRVGIDVAHVGGVDPCGGCGGKPLVERGVERDGDEEIGVGVGLVAGGFEPSTTLVRVSARQLKNGIVSIDEQEELVSVAVAACGADEVEVVSVDGLRRGCDIATVSSAEVTDDACAGLERAGDAAVGACVLSFVRAEAMDGVDGGAAAPFVFEVGEEGVVGGVAEIVESGFLVVERCDACDG